MATTTPAPVNIRSREVQATVDRAQHRRQRLVFAIQLLFGVNIALVYAATAHVSNQELIHSTGASLIACYAFFSLWCVHRSSKQRLRWYDVVLSIALDYGLYIMVILQLGHGVLASSGEAGASPLFAYVYLFIAIRCLHYDAAYVYLSGVLASVAWFLLMLSANAGSTTSLLDSFRNLTFVEAVLTGAVDKLLSIVAVTIVLAQCVREARKHLYTSVLRGVAGKGLARMVGQDVAKEILFSKEVLVPGKGKHQSVAILMMDIKNFTKIAAHADPSDVIAMLATYQQLVEPVIVRYGGCIDKFMGDGILAHFGALEPNPSYVAQALRCVEHLLYETDRWNGRRIASGFKPFHFRVACAAGNAVVGLVGGSTKMEFTIIGDPVNTTAKLEKHAKKLNARALTTARAFEMAKGQGYKPAYPIRKVNAEAIPGIERPLDLVVLGDLPGTLQNRPPPAPTNTPSPRRPVEKATRPALAKSATHRRVS